MIEYDRNKKVFIQKAKVNNYRDGLVTSSCSKTTCAKWAILTWATLGKRAQGCDIDRIFQRFWDNWRKRERRCASAIPNYQKLSRWRWFLNSLHVTAPQAINQCNGLLCGVVVIWMFITNKRPGKYDVTWGRSKTLGDVDHGGFGKFNVKQPVQKGIYLQICSDDLKCM